MPTTFSSDQAVVERRANLSPLAINLVLLLSFAALTRYNCARLFGVTLPDLISIKGALSAGGFTVLSTMLPARTRKMLLVHARRILTARITFYLSITLLLAAMALTAVASFDVQWIGSNTITINKNGWPVTLDSAAADTTKSGRLYAPSGSRVKLSAGAFTTEFRANPFNKKSIILPFYATSSQNPRLAQAEYRILSTFFTLFDRVELANLHSTLSDIKPSGILSNEAISRLNLIRDAIDNAANTPSSIDTKMAVVDNFIDQYPNDPWAVLLRAQAFYSSNQFSDCAKELAAVPGQSTVIELQAIYATEEFFRGICKMKSVVVKPGDSNLQKHLLAEAQADMQRGADRLMNVKTDEGLHEAARIGNVMYRAICDYYSNDMKAAATEFHEAADMTSGSQQARARNNAGFAAFVLGDFTESDKDYSQAYEAQPSFQYIKENLAYLRLAEGETENAKKAFTDIASDVDVARTSPQDAILSKIMLLELDQDAGLSLEQANERYSVLLANKGAANWDYEANAKVRYALLVHEVVRRVYLDGDYFGLEMFALTSACKAKQIVVASSTDARDRALALSDLDGDLEILSTRVYPTWLQTKHKGWFSHLDECSAASVGKSKLS